MKIPRTIVTTLGWLTAVGVLVSVLNEFGSVDTYQLGVATVTRPLHALLGLLSLTWLFCGHRAGLLALGLWIALAIPVIGIDQSKEWVEPLMNFGANKANTNTVGFNDDGPFITDYRKVGINVAPVIVAIWFFFLAQQRAFPLLRARIPRKVLQFSATAMLLILLSTGIYIYWLLSAPYLLIASEPRMSFYFEDEKLADRFLRVTPELIDRLGLDGSIPPEQWSMRTDFGFFIFVSDGKSESAAEGKRIMVATDNDDSELLRIETPWGERVMQMCQGGSEPEGRYQFYYMQRKKSFQVKAKAPEDPVVAGEYFPLEISVEVSGKLPSFAQLDFTIATRGWDTAKGEYPVRERRFAAPESFLRLNEKRKVEGVIQVQAPFRPGNHLLMAQGWMSDSNGRNSRPKPSLGYSSSPMIQVIRTSESSLDKYQQQD